MEDLTLRQIRRAKEITQQELADKLGIHINTYTRWEEKPSEIKMEFALKICEILGVEFKPSIFLP